MRNLGETIISLIMLHRCINIGQCDPDFSVQSHIYTIIYKSFFIAKKLYASAIQQKIASYKAHYVYMSKDRGHGQLYVWEWINGYIATVCDLMTGRVRPAVISSC